MQNLYVRHARKGWVVWLTVIFLLAGCSTVPYEKGAIWCNEPLKYSPGTHFDKRHMNVARGGYIYALAAAWVLQTNPDETQRSDEDEHHWFNLPERLKEVDRPQRDASGFEAAAFLLFESANDNKPVKVIVAFTGSNDAADWVFTNLFSSRAQFDLARSYAMAIAQRYPDVPMVVTGFSLGGALATHVTKDVRTRALISEAWVFNPSPKFYGSNAYDTRIWIGALRGEALKLIRNPVMEKVWPGVGRIGAPWYQDAQDYYLISAFPIYGHYRWALARNILFVADYAHLQHPMGPLDSRYKNEPREILEASKFKACEKEEALRGRVIQSQYPEQVKVSDEQRKAQMEAAGVSDLMPSE